MRMPPSPATKGAAADAAPSDRRRPPPATRKLDPAQAAAARGEGQVQLTLAGPGSGKTSTLTGRFFHLVRGGVDPGRILTLTFTRKAADEMRERIESLLPALPAGGLDVMTFHAFAFRLLRRNPSAAGLPERFALWDQAAQRQVFSSRQMWWNEEKDILDIIGGAKERLLDAEAFAASIDPDDEVLADAVKFFRAYEQALKEAGAIDFTDMVPRLVKAMDDAGYRRSITGAYDHVLVDEYQDVNPGQIALIDRFVADGAQVWAVGDDDQTLYAFRASDIRHIVDFERRYPGARLHVLDRNYRSAADIVMAAKRLIRANLLRIDKDYHPTIGESGLIVIRGYPEPPIEARQVARAIAELSGRGWPLKQIAVLYRTSAVGLPFQTVLKEMAIPFEVRGGGDVWQGVAARLMLGALFYLRDGASVEAMSRIGTNRRGRMLREDLDVVRPAVRTDFRAAAEAAQRLVGEAVPARSSDREHAEWRMVVDTVAALAATCASPEELEERIAAQSASLRAAPGDAVVLSTIHSAKGLEWDAVFLAGMEDGVLPHANCDDVEEERRIAYVGLTRARRLIGLTYAAERYGTPTRASPFLAEIAGKDRRFCAWSGPTAKGASGRLPLLTAGDRRQLAARRAEAESPAARPRQERGAR
jgi:DNA helicase II / ATP-dependent DNA helicase PcrA